MAKQRRMPERWLAKRALPIRIVPRFYVCCNHSCIQCSFDTKITILEDLCLNQQVADVVVILGSVDIVLGEVDR